MNKHKFGKANLNLLKRIASFSFVCILLCTKAQAQDFYPYPTYNESLKQGIDLYEKEMYKSALEKLEKARSATPKDKVSMHDDINFYMAMCALKSKHSDAEAQLMLVLENPSNPHYVQAAYGYAKYLYAKEDYRKASDWFLEVNEFDLAQTDRDEFLFKAGHSYYLSGDKEIAKANFRKIKDQKNSYADAALYYYSHMEYEDGNHVTASNGFERLRQNPNYSSIIPYYALQIAFIQKDYDKVIKEGELFLQLTADSRKGEINRLLAESYMYKGNPDKATEYFKAFEKSTKQMSREDNFLKGYLQYQTKDYSGAAKSFDAAATINDSLTQHCYYYSADCFIKINNKAQAMEGFRKASEMSYESNIQKDALLNYSKLLLELKGDDRAMNEYLMKYPNAKNNNELVTYIASSSAKKGDFRESLALLNSIKSPSPEEIKAIQKISLASGLTLMKSKEYEEAIKMFDASIKSSLFNDPTSALANYWKAEALFQMGNYKDASNLFEAFIQSEGAFANHNEYTVAHYNIAYCYFKQKNYDNALRWFRNYINFEGQSTRKTIYLGDSYNRVGDCYYKKRQFPQAIENYEIAENLNLSNPDYSAYQKAMSLGFTSNIDNKITNLQYIPKKYPNSPYLPAVYYEIGRSYQQLMKYTEAANSFQTITRSYSKTQFYSKALVELGLIELNRGNPDKALSYYQQVVEKSPSSPEATDALEGIKSIYMDKNRMDEYFAYASRVGQTISSPDARDSLVFTAAEKQYQSGNCTEALAAVSKYLVDFPNGKNRLAANFYKADCSMKDKKYNDALEGYNNVLSQDKNVFTESAWSGYALANYNLKNYARAANGFEELKKISQSNTTLLDAEVGAMRSYIEMNNYEKAAIPAARVAISKGISSDLVREANLVLGRSEQGKGNYQKAIELLTPLTKDFNKAIDAEAQFRIIECYYSMNKQREAEDAVYSFADSKSTQQYWMAKAFIVLGDIYVKRNDFNQARATYQSILSGYPNKTDGVVEDATKRYSDIEHK